MCFKASVSELEEYVNASSAERLRIEERQRQQEEVFTSVINELEQIPGRVESGVEALLKAEVMEPMKQWAQSNCDWQIVVVDEDELGSAGGHAMDEMEQRLAVAGAKKGKNQNDDLAKQGVFQMLGEPVISSSPEANTTALALSSGLSAGTHPSVSSGGPNGLDESRSVPKQTALRQPAARR